MADFSQGDFLQLVGPFPMELADILHPILSGYTFCGPNRSKVMTGAFLSASVDPPFKESTDSGLWALPKKKENQFARYASTAKLREAER